MKSKKAYINHLALVILLFLAMVCLLSVSMGSNQASLSIPLPLTFSGEYSYDEENWTPLSDDAELSALCGSVILRGHLNEEIPEGAYLYYYRNHIGVSMYINGEQWALDAITDCASRGIGLMASMCGREWGSIYSPDINPEDELEIHLYNPHAHGNGTAYRDFLNTFCCGPDPEKTGLLTLFTSGFFIFDTIDVCFWSDLVVLNTYARQLCMMLAVFCLGHYICDVLTGKMQNVARAAVLIGALLNAVLIVLSFTGVAVIYDTYIYWAASQWILCPLLSVCCILQLRCTGKKNVLMLVSGILLCITILLDIAGIGPSILSHGSCSKRMFCLLLVVHIVVASKKIVTDHRVSIQVQKLEQELQESRISIMLSQLRPHFLFNVLNSIYYLCGKNPETAKKMVEKFSTYLRNNLDSLDQKTMIPFHTEFDHIQTYLELEKLRFDEELTIVYDIQADYFSLPVLTVQPLVENAVKHGITKKSGGGILTLSTREETERYVITVADTGVGFDQEHYMDDGKTHIGIENVRQRLEHMAGGTLKITSIPGEGTTAVIIIPKKE